MAKMIDDRAILKQIRDGEPLQPAQSAGDGDEEIRIGNKLQEAFRTFGVEVTIEHVSRGPVFTRYELRPGRGVRVSQILDLSDDIRLALGAAEIHIEAPVPGTGVIGFAVPNRDTEAAALRDILESEEFRRTKSPLAFGLGRDIGGRCVVADIERMPHLLIAGATGSGKSVCINTIIMSILCHATPEKVKFLMIDTRAVDLSVYNNIPYLLMPVITDPGKAVASLGWAVAEMERRYKLFSDACVRDIKGYNASVKALAEDDGELEMHSLPRIVIIVDELADLMMTARDDVETAIMRLSRMARAAGIHLVITTGCPSVNVITEPIRINMPSRIAFSVTSQVDSRTILDMAGAEKLLGRGDMLYFPQSLPMPIRVQGAFVSDEEVSRVVEAIRRKGAHQDQKSGKAAGQSGHSCRNVGGAGSTGGTGSKGALDPLFVEAGRFIIEKDKASIGYLQRGFKIGFNRAARIMDQLSEAGVVSSENGTRARTILMTLPEFNDYVDNNML